MSQVAEEPTILFPPEQCPHCKADPSLVPEQASGLRNFRCPSCAKKLCTNCFKANFDDPVGHTFFCPHCRQLLAFPKVC